MEISMRMDASTQTSQEYVSHAHPDSEDVESQPMQRQRSETSKGRSETDETSQSAADSSETLFIKHQDSSIDVAVCESHEDPYSDFPTADTPETPIVIQAGERRFTTFKTTLTQGSSYYRALFSGSWRNCPQPDGSYFVDIDGDLFAHLLKFLRHGMYPRAIHNAEDRIDREFYGGLLDAAGFLGVDGLYQWLLAEEYFSLR